MPLQEPKNLEWAKIFIEKVFKAIHEESIEVQNNIMIDKTRKHAEKRVFIVRRFRKLHK